MGGTAEEVGRQAEDSDWIDQAVRFGLVVYGLVYLLIASLAALKQLLKQPYGSWLLLAMAAGLVCYGQFQLARARHVSR